MAVETAIHEKDEISAGKGPRSGKASATEPRSGSVRDEEVDR